jgi:LemA protein
MALLIALAVGLGIILVLALWFFGIYNGLVRLRQEVKNAWAQIDVQLKRRHDLIEKSTLEEVVKARAAAVSAQGVEAQGAAERGLSGALGRLMVVVEQYPDLKANQNFLALQEELTSTENKIGFSRQYYNDSVMQYNTRIQVVPANVVAGMCQFRSEAFFEIEDQAERAVPQVKF